MIISTKGQVTIPIEIRNKMGMLPDTEVSFVIRNDGVLIRKKSRAKKLRGLELAAHMSGKGDVKMTTDEIMKLMRS